MKIGFKQGMLAVLVAAVMGMTSAAVQAAAITPGNILVYRVGNTTTALANTGNAVFVDEFSPTGTLVQSIAMPMADGGGNFGLVASGTATSEGLITVSPDGKFVALAGYRSTHSSSLSAANGTTINRTIGIIPVATGTPSVTTALTDFASGNNPRSVVTTDGTSLWLAGGAGGVRYTTVGSSSSTQLTTLANVRQVNIFDGQLYVTSNSTSGGNTVSIGTVGTGLPTTTGQTLTTLPGLTGVSGTSRYAFFFADLDSSVVGVDTLYIADDSSLAITKYSLVSGSWVSNGTIGTDAQDYRGITGYVSGSTVQLFATRSGGSSASGGGELVSILDASGYNGAFIAPVNVLASAITGTSANTAFRGVAYVIPEPATMALLALGSGMMLLRRRQA